MRDASLRGIPRLLPVLVTRPDSGFWHGVSDKKFLIANLTLKKIPNAVLARCEWGKDDYSLQVQSLPEAPPEPGQIELI